MLVFFLLFLFATVRASFGHKFLALPDYVKEIVYNHISGDVIYTLLDTKAYDEIYNQVGTLLSSCGAASLNEDDPYHFIFYSSSTSIECLRKFNPRIIKPLFDQLKVVVAYQDGFEFEKSEVFREFGIKGELILADADAMLSLATSSADKISTFFNNGNIVNVKMLLGRDYLEESVMSLDIIAGRLDNIKCLNLISLVDIDADYIAPFFMKLKSSNLKSLTLDGFFFPGYSNNVKNMLMLADSYSNLQHLKLKMPSRDYPLAKEHNLMTILFSKMDESKITKLELELRSALIINFSFLANKTRKVKYLHLTVPWISKEHILTFLRSASKTLESLNIFSSETTILPVSFIDTLDMYLGRTMINRILLILGKTEITGVKINGHYEYLTESLQEDQ